MYLHEEAIKALIEYRKRNGYTRRLRLTSRGDLLLRHDEKPLTASDIPF